MEKREYLTIRELSLILGISRQSVYKHVDKKLTGFTTKLNGKDKVVKIEALKEVYGLDIEESCRKLDDIIKSKSKGKSADRVNVDSKPDNQTVNIDSKLDNQTVNVDSKPDNQEKELILAYKERIEQLEQDKKQLQEDKRLLNEDKRVLNGRIDKYDARLKETLELVSQEQKLNLANKNKISYLEEQLKEAKKQIPERTSEVVSKDNPEPTPKETDQTHEAPSDSKKWWQFWK